MRALLHIPKPLDAVSLTAALEGLTAYNAAWLRAHPSAPSLYAAGVRYEREPKGREDWRTLPDLLKRKRGDCEDLAAARAAELRQAGDPGAHAFARKVRPGLWHIRVRHGDGTTEDPSIVLGMKGPETMAGTDGGEFKGGWRIFRSGGRWRFELDLPMGMVAAGTGTTKPDAMRAASALAQQALKNPYLRAALPPQAQAALKAASLVAKSPAAAKAWSATKKAGGAISSLAKSIW